MFFFLRFKEITPADQEQKCKTISEEHGKQIHLKESLKIEEQMKNFIKESEEEEKRISQEAEKVELQIRKAKRDLSVAKDESHLRGVVQDMFHNVSAGENSLQPVVRTLGEILSKCFLITERCFNVIYLFFYFILTDPLNFVKRNSKKQTDTVETTFYDVKAIREDIAFLKQDYLEFKGEIRQVIKTKGRKKEKYISLSFLMPFILFNRPSQKLLRLLQELI